jgi:hypothetical protein
VNLNVFPKSQQDSRRSVEELIYAGETENFVARYLELTHHELRAQYRDALLNGHVRRRAEVIAMLFEAARNGDTRAILRLEKLGRSRSDVQI